MEHIHPMYTHTARGWVHNVENRRNWPYHFALVESEKICPIISPQRSLSASEIPSRVMPHGYADGIENRCYSWYTYRDGTGRILVRQNTLTTAHSRPVTYTEMLRECYGRSGTYICL